MAEHKIEERIEFLTQIHTAWDSTEQRMALRKRPRRTFSYRYTSLNDYEAEWIRSINFTKNGKQVDMPVWHNGFIAVENIYEKQSRIKIPDEKYVWGFRDCVKVMLYTNPEEGGEVYEVDSVSSDYIHLSEQIKSDFKKGISFVVPVIYAYILQNSDYTNETVSTVDNIISFEIINSVVEARISEYFNEDNYPIPIYEYGKNLIGNYHGLEVFMLPPQWDGTNTVIYDINADAMDNQTGRNYYCFKSESPLAIHSLKYMLKNKEDLNYIERFFYRTKGQYKSFFMPTWTQDFTLVNNVNVGDNELIVSLNVYYNYYAKIKRRRRIIVFYKDGTAEILNIAGFSYTNDGKYGKIFLNSTLTHLIYVKDVLMISFFVCARLNSDVLEIDHETNETALITIDIKELDDE